MTNLEGLWILYVALILFIVCLVVTAVLVGILGWERRTDTRSRRLLRVRIALAALGLGISTIAWGFALLYMTPSGIIERLLRPNPIMIVLVLGYTLPGILGGYFLWSDQSGGDLAATQ